MKRLLHGYLGDHHWVVVGEGHGIARFSESDHGKAAARPPTFYITHCYACGATKIKHNGSRGEVSAPVHWPA